MLEDIVEDVRTSQAESRKTLKAICKSTDLWDLEKEVCVFQAFVWEVRAYSTMSSNIFQENCGKTTPCFRGHLMHVFALWCLHLLLRTLVSFPLQGTAPLEAARAGLA